MGLKWIADLLQCRQLQVARIAAGGKRSRAAPRFPRRSARWRVLPSRVVTVISGAGSPSEVPRADPLCLLESPAVDGRNKNEIKQRLIGDDAGDRGKQQAEGCPKPGAAARGPVFEEPHTSHKKLRPAAAAGPRRISPFSKGSIATASSGRAKDEGAIGGLDLKSEIADGRHFEFEVADARGQDRGQQHDQDLRPGEWLAALRVFAHGETYW